MKPSFVTSADGTRIAYDRNDAGPPIVLLHGGGGSRQEWHTAGYVDRLQDNFTVISVDLRGHGESDLPTAPADYAIDKLVKDILAVADACGTERFTLWGMSYGGKVGRYVAVQSERVARLTLMGTPFGPGVADQLRQDAIDFRAHWPPIVQAQREGSLDLDSLSQNDRDTLSHIHVPVVLAWARAMLDWPAVEPADFRCPTLWLAGSEDRHAMASLQEYQPSLAGSEIQVQLMAGLDHEQVFDEIDQVFPILLAFTRSAS